MGIFMKPFRVKSNSQLKGSDKKKLKAQLRQSFPSLTEDHMNALIPTKDEIILSKIYTFGGDSVLLYIHNRDTVFFQMEKDKNFYPSVYTLWKHPELLPVFTTFVPVMARISNGADLMLPGIIIDETKGIKAYCDGKLEKGDIVAINLANNLAPIAIGKTHRSSEDMYMAVRRGKGVDIIHSYGDQLWMAGSRLEVPDLGPPTLPSNSQEEYEDDGDEEEDVDGDAAQEEEPPEQDLESRLAGLEVKESADSTNTPQGVELTGQPVDARSSTEMMDEWLTNAFYQTWKTSGRKIEFPILTSNFFRLHMVNNCPAGVTLDPKKSSFKKLSKFLAAMDKLGIIKVKELQKGVESIISVDMVHDKITSFRTMKIVKPEEDKPVESILPCDKLYEPPKIVELQMVNANVLKLFSSFKLQKGRGLTSSEVRDLIVKYVKENNLQDPVHKTLVKLDPILAEVVLGRGENNVVEMKWDELTQRVISKMSDGFSLQFPGQPPEFHKGKLDPVEMTTATRSGNKKITLVYNLETYRIDPHQFAHKCQVGVAASTSVSPAVNRKSGSEVMIQGNQILFASRLLMEEYRIPKKYIRGIEQAPKKKK